MLATIDAPKPALEPAGRLRERFQNDKAVLLARFASARPTAPAAAALLKALTRLVDQTLLTEQWHTFRVHRIGRELQRSPYAPTRSASPLLR